MFNLLLSVLSAAKPFNDDWDDDDYWDDDETSSIIDWMFPNGPTDPDGEY